MWLSHSAHGYLSVSTEAHAAECESAGWVRLPAGQSPGDAEAAKAKASAKASAKVPAKAPVKAKPAPKAAASLGEMM